MGVIAEQLGHADTRMTEKHYAHLAPSYVADTIRAHFPNAWHRGRGSRHHNWTTKEVVPTASPMRNARAEFVEGGGYCGASRARGRISRPSSKPTCSRVTGDPRCGRACHRKQLHPDAGRLEWRADGATLTAKSGPHIGRQPGWYRCT